jgi:hypothetical protein
MTMLVVVRDMKTDAERGGRIIRKPFLEFEVYLKG